jgi:diguanylate cyclase (GGDEF)-like protein
MEWLNALVAPPANGQLTHGFRHDYRLFLLALLAACAAGYGLLGMIERAVAAQRIRIRLLWNSLAIANLAGGLWATQFVAALSVTTPFVVVYDFAGTNISIFPAVIAATLTVLQLSRNGKPPRARRAAAALYLCLGACAVSMTTLIAMNVGAALRLNFLWLVAAPLVAGTLCYWALSIASHSSAGTSIYHRYRLLAGILLGTGLIATHYCGVQAMSVLADSNSAPQWQAASNRTQLAIAIGVITLLLMLTTLLAEHGDRALQRHERDLKRANALLRRLDRSEPVLREEAHLDTLTNLMNRRGLEHTFDARLTEHRETDQPLAVMFLDIDHFKRINDSLGHDAGDELLKVIAQRIRSQLRDGDAVARFGGDEFCMLIPVDHPGEARALAQRVMQKMKEPISLSGRNLVMTTSIGVSLFPQHGDTMEALLKHADLALYRSKDAGRDEVRLFDDELMQQTEHELRVEKELREALTTGEGLSLYYQPVVTIMGGETVQLEALIRWHHPRYGLIPAERFISVAEASGFIGDLDRWAISRACHDISELTRQGHKQVQVAINCSALNFADEELPRTLEVALRRSGVSPFRLTVEITEDALTANIQRTVKLLKKIHRLGVSVSIDNFGTGYSSLPYLKRLPLEMVKIDRAFTQELSIATESHEIVHAIIAMAHAMQLKVVAEGVETEEQLAHLRSLGCDLVQGHLLSSPMDLQTLLQYLTKPAIHSL